MLDEFENWLEEQYKQTRDKFIDETADAVFSPRRGGKTTRVIELSKLMAREDTLREALDKYRSLKPPVPTEDELRKRLDDNFFDEEFA